LPQLIPSIVFVIVVMKRTLASRALVAGIVLVSGAVLSACGGDSDSAGIDPDDVEFVQGMIPHHEQAVEMSALALDGRGGAAVQELARRIQAAQDPEIVAMRAILSRWGIEEDEHAMHHSPDDAAMMGMLTDGQMGELEVMSGADFDQRWIQLMIMHHEGAVSMAEAVLAGGVDEEVRAIAAGVKSVQLAEIAELRALLNG
jgi:uncharacterized protein (DUF305 family)